MLGVRGGRDQGSGRGDEERVGAGTKGVVAKNKKCELALNIKLH